AANLDANGVRMYVAEVLLGESDVDAHLLGDAEGLGDARVVDVEADRAADQREVGTVAAVRRGERRVEEEAHGDGILVEDLARHTAEARGARGVRARRADHHRPHHVENRNLPIMANGHVLESAPQCRRSLPSWSSTTTSRSCCSCASCWPSSASKRSPPRAAPTPSRPPAPAHPTSSCSTKTCPA